MVLKTLKIASGSVRTNFPSHSYARTHVEAIIIVIKIHYTWVTDGNLALEDGCLVKPFNEINQRWLDSVHKCCNLCIFQPLQTGGFVVNLLFICFTLFCFFRQLELDLQHKQQHRQQCQRDLEEVDRMIRDNGVSRWLVCLVLSLWRFLSCNKKNCALTGFISAKKLKALVITIP